MTRTLATLFLALALPAAAQDGPPEGAPEAMFRSMAAEAGRDYDSLAAPDPEGPTLVSIDFAYALPEPAFAAQMEGSAPFLAEVPGLVWKVWTYDPEARVANGTYLFANEDAARFYVDRVFAMGPPTRDGYSDFDIRILEIMDAPSRVTRAPLN